MENKMRDIQFDVINFKAWNFTRCMPRVLSRNQGCAMASWRKTE